ncbi:MAG: hypothetical protein AMXMBFR44_3960 [Candidatus Campbellbacteria bacterium]
MKIEHVDITPDRSIYHKIGEANYSISDAVAELVDNSIDAANEDGVEIVIVLDKKNKKIIIEDNGKGMDKEVAANALKLAHSQKKDSLGEFGLGLKSACTSLGKKFQLVTTPKGSPESYVLTYDREQFMKEGRWDAFPISITDTAEDNHGTTVEISNLKVKLYDALVTRLKEDLSQRYGPFIQHNNVVIKVGLRNDTAKPCTPTPVELDEDGQENFEYVLANGARVYGWWGLRKVASGTQSGFNIFRRGRLIRANERLGYNPHPMTNHVFGEIHLDAVPVTHNKREFITESGEFREFIENFWGDKTGKLVGERISGLIDKITKKAQDRWNQNKAERQLPDSLKETVKDNILRALNRVDEFKELAFPLLNTAKKRSETGELLPQELREEHKNVASEEDVQLEIQENEKRTPKKTQQKRAKFIIINGRKFHFDFFWKDLQDPSIDKESVTTENGVEIYINTGFPGFGLSKDSQFYCVFHVAEAISELYLKEAEQPINRMVELRNKLLNQVASVILEEEEIRKLEKQEEELTSILAEKNRLKEKVRASKL